MLKSQNPVGAYCNTPVQTEKNVSVGAKNVSPVHAEKTNVGAKSAKAEYVSNTPLQNEKMPVQPQQNEKNYQTPVGATHRKRYLASLREAYADALFHKFMNELSGTLTMKLHKGTWHLVFSCGGENGMIQAKGKTLAHALINLATKSPSLGGVSDSEEVIWGGTSKTIAL